MLAVGRQIGLADTEWLPADMQALPFPDASFDLVIAQFGVMLVPDKSKALSEARRVLAPGGALLFNAWSSPDKNTLFKTLADVIATDPGLLTEGIDRIRAMLGMASSMADTTAVATALAAAGFSSCTHEVVPLVVEAPGVGARLARGFLMGSPMAAFIAEGSRDAVVAAVAAALGDRVVCEAVVYDARA